MNGSAPNSCCTGSQDVAKRNVGPKRVIAGHAVTAIVTTIASTSPMSASPAARCVPRKTASPRTLAGREQRLALERDLRDGGFHLLHDLRRQRGVEEISGVLLAL